MDGCKAKNNSIKRYQIRARWKVVGEISKSNEQDLWIERVRGLISYLVLTSNFEHFRLGFFLHNSSNKEEQFSDFRQKVIADFA